MLSDQMELLAREGEEDSAVAVQVLWRGNQVRRQCQVEAGLARELGRERTGSALVIQAHARGMLVCQTHGSLQ